MSKLLDAIAKGWTLADGVDGANANAIHHFEELVTQHPKEPLVHYELASIYDYSGKEAEAIPHYEHAIAMGLSEPHLQRAILQLGSSLRNVEQYDQAIDVLRDGCKRFPNHEPLQIFLALVLHSAGHAEGAVITLLELALTNINSPEMELYHGAMRRYTDALKEA